MTGLEIDTMTGVVVAGSTMPGAREMVRPAE
jgi:hypothetical protein